MKISLRRPRAPMVDDEAFIHKIDYVKFFLQILKGIQIALLVQKLWPFCWIGVFCLFVELHWEGSARSLRSSFFFFLIKEQQNQNMISDKGEGVLPVVNFSWQGGANFLFWLPRGPEGMQAAIFGWHHMWTAPEHNPPFFHRFNKFFNFPEKW